MGVAQRRGAQVILLLICVSTNALALTTIRRRSTVPSEVIPSADLVASAPGASGSSGSGSDDSSDCQEQAEGSKCGQPARIVHTLHEGLVRPYKTYQVDETPIPHVETSAAYDPLKEMVDKDPSVKDLYERIRTLENKLRADEQELPTDKQKAEQLTENVVDKKEQLKKYKKEAHQLQIELHVRVIADKKRLLEQRLASVQKQLQDAHSKLFKNKKKATKLEEEQLHIEKKWQDVTGEKTATATSPSR